MDADMLAGKMYEAAEQFACDGEGLLPYARALLEAERALERIDGCAENPCRVCSALDAIRFLTAEKP